MHVVAFACTQSVKVWPWFEEHESSYSSPSAIDSESIEPLSVLHSKLRFEW